VSKIHTLDTLAEAVAEHRREGAVVVMAHGTFDLLHVGHTSHLESAKRLGNVLIVTVTADAFVNKGQGRPRFHQQLRAKMIAALQCVDYVAINHTQTAAEAIGLLKPHIFVKGEEYRGIEAEKDALRQYGGEMEYVSGEVVFSSTELLGGVK
jgi:rfaE bifunctional protein nucleotidyltransferase chain/domain